MNKTLSTTLIVIAVLILAGGIFFAGSMYARTNAYGPSMMFGYGWSNDNYTFGPGMTLAPGASAGVNGRGGYGMMGGMMGAGRGGYGMMGGYGWYNGTNSNVTPLNVDQASQAAEKYIQSLNLQGLETGEVMIFDNNAYVIVKETETGLGAFELLVDPVSQIAYPEYGPNMMWNLKYGGLGHGSMMGGYGGMTLAPGASAGVGGWNYQTTPSTNVTTEMTVTPEQAVEYAQQYLDISYKGATAATDPMQFYGYYTLDFEKDGQIIGMLSVNGYNGQTFLHTWHGAFIEETE
ncbi:MAG: hypothetical protein HZB19_06950 [Chloroflexi bacterium]|nr:hypothetical protein [Chloroflexota bacterium]